MGDNLGRIYAEAPFFDKNMKIEIRKMIARENPKYLQREPENYLVRLNTLPPALIDRLYNYIIAKRDRQTGQ